MSKVNDVLKNGAARGWEAWVRWGANAILIPIAGILIWMFVDIQVIKDNRWSSGDQAVFAERVWDAINQKANRSEVPPSWFERQQNEIKAELITTNERLNELSTEVAELRAELRAHRQDSQ